MANHDSIHDAPADDIALLRRYRAAFTQSREAILFFQHGRIFDCNPAALALFRIQDPTQLAKLDIVKLSPPTQPSGQRSDMESTAHIRLAFNTGQAFFDWQMRDLNGREFPAEVMLYRLDLPEGTVLQATVRDISEQEAQRQALLQRKQDLLEAQRIARLGNWVSDFERGEIRWCEQIYQMFGRPLGEPITHAIFMQAVHPDDRERVQAAFDAALRGAPYDITHRVVPPDGNVRTVHERGQIEFGPKGQARRMIGTVQDITEQKTLEHNLRRLVAILDSTSDFITMHGPDGGMLYMNSAGRRFHGLPAASVSDEWNPEQGWRRHALPQATRSIAETIRFFHPEWAAQRIEQKAMPTALRAGIWQGESALLNPDGDEVPVSQVIIVHYDEHGNVDQTSTMIRDISEQKHLEAELARNAITDHLTGAFNRKRFDEEIEKALARRRRNGVSTALILLDIDHFKPVNDTHGHDVGDQVLVELTQLIQNSLRVPDFLARWGGEEFVLLLPDTGMSEAHYLAERLRQLIASHRFGVVGTITASLGVTILQPTDCPHSCIKRLDEALYGAKHAGRNQVIGAPPIISTRDQVH
ncbi:diguanylate cyclase [Halomonas vilamensis]|uniref:diguanylate cyclase n=1 Tax=Vreelandella vilamensis TaxID=531309 RepID=A0ABU1H310_9GAMM|nr:diguanylate cyclase [Halomonas vilamensis]MDR5898676.1 diguanylate cyclase [Halomonas vilamensis]